MINQRLQYLIECDLSTEMDDKIWEKIDEMDAHDDMELIAKAIAFVAGEYDLNDNFIKDTWDSVVRIILEDFEADQGEYDPEGKFGSAPTFFGKA